ncbi:MAG: hypothetical protein ACLQAT_03460 [Candidatus Binataceae bacterium]
MRDRAYQIYLEFLETADNKRRWNIFNDVPWEKLDSGKASDQVGDRVKIFCSEELGCRDKPSIVSSPGRLAAVHDVGNQS